MKLKVLRVAKQELQDATDWYAARRPGLDQKFLNSIDAAIQSIIAHPRTWPDAGFGTQKYGTTQFPYSIIYTCNDDEITIIAVAHTSRRPGYWRSRLKH
jgi:plasmid stabilization system protein ParE